MPPSTNALSPRTAAELLERILAASSGVVALDAAGPAVIEQFTQIARHSGQAIYLWQPDTGLATLRELDTCVPGSQRLGGALRCIQQSNHFGVYLFRLPELRLEARDAGLLRQLAHESTAQIRRTVLLDAPAPLPVELDGWVERVAQAQAAPRPRLRDGRWIG